MSTETKSHNIFESNWRLISSTWVNGYELIWHKTNTKLNSILDYLRLQHVGVNE